MRVVLVTTPVEKMKEIVILMTNARKATGVEMLIAEVLLVSIHYLIVAIV